MEIMKLKWTKEITLGLLIGVVSPFVFMLLIIFVMSDFDGTQFLSYFESVLSNFNYLSKYLSLGLISNLIWFYFFLNREKYEYTRGIILGMLCYIPFMVYVNV
jgi:uncharacterized BrkB/YihY/UPF0761 family membrane protein